MLIYYLISSDGLTGSHKKTSGICVGSQKAEIKMSAGLHSLLEYLAGISAFRFIQFVGKIQFFIVVGLKSISFLAVGQGLFSASRGCWHSLTSFFKVGNLLCIEFVSCFWSLWCPFLLHFSSAFLTHCISLTPMGEMSLLSRAQGIRLDPLW